MSRRLSNELTPIRALLTDVQNETGSLGQLRQHWSRAVGPRIAERSHPLSLERGILTVQVASSAWAHELSFLSETIQLRLQKAGLAVESLRFRVRAMPKTRPSWSRTRSVPQPADLPVELRQQLGQIDDARLRDAIAEAAAHGLAVSNERLRVRAPSASRRVSPSSTAHNEAKRSSPAIRWTKNRSAGPKRS